MASWCTPVVLEPYRQKQENLGFETNVGISEFQAARTTQQDPVSEKKKKKKKILSIRVERCFSGSVR